MRGKEERAIKSLFVQNTSQGYRLLGLSLLSLVLMFADSRLDYLSRLRYYTSVAVTPLHFVASLPGRAAESMLGSVRSRDELAAENARLQEELLMQQSQLQKLDYLTAENAR